jgi:hypothetical protein
MRVFKTVAAALLAAGVAVFAGCTRGPKKDEDFTPPPDKAKQALEAALTHWQGGNPPRDVPGGPPAVWVVDSVWKSGQQLKAFEVLGEDSPPAGAGSAPRYFKVRLTPAKGPPQEVRYVVVGIDPLWVYREKDFDSLSGVGK